jgi:hypothetical protein
MQVRLPLLSVLAATALSLGVALPSFARPAVLVGMNPDSRINVRTEPTTDAFSPHYGLVGDQVEIVDQVLRVGCGAIWCVPWAIILLLLPIIVPLI